MKQFLIGGSLLLLLSAATGCKKCDEHTSCPGKYSGAMQVIKDCTGDYLRFGQKDYKVCNAGIVANYQSGDTVTASFDKTANCSTPTMGLCNMWHENEGYVTVNCIEKTAGQ